MIRSRCLHAATLLTLCAASLLSAADWPSFRGPAGIGVLTAEEGKNLPTDFDGATGKLIRWKTAISLPGESSPIVTGNRVFLSGGDTTKRTLSCFDADTGKLLWEEKVDAGGKLPGEPDADPLPAGLAAPTPVTDGKHVAVVFGNGDIAAFDLEGKKLWSFNLAKFEGGYGYGSSPIVVGKNVIVQFDYGVQPADPASFLIAIDFETGKTVWKAKRDVYGSWTTPITVTVKEKVQIITVADPWVTAYAADTGEELWKAKCIGADPAPSAAAFDGIVYATVARNALSAIKADGKGDVTKTHILWRNEDEEFPEVPSPVTNGKRVFLALDNGIFVAYDAATGKKLWDHDCEADFRASPTLIGDQVWIMDRKGVLHRFAAGEKDKELGKASLGEPVDAQPAYAGNRIFVRGKKNLYCIGEK